MAAHASVFAPRTPGAARLLSIRPLAISATTRAALAQGNPVVAAEHRLGASLDLPGTDDAVFMSSPGTGLLPAHIVVRARDLACVLRASQTGGRVALRVDVRNIRTFRPTLAPNPQAMQSSRARSNIEAARQWLSAPATSLGLGVSAAELLAPVVHSQPYLASLNGGTAVPDSALRALIGRGAGTTPAGDDILVGALAYAWATKGTNAPLAAAMRRLEAEFAALTTTVGATYLRAAVRGEFGSHLIAWVHALPRVSTQCALALARRVANHGASSGYDTLAGFIAAANASPRPEMRSSASISKSTPDRGQ